MNIVGIGTDLVKFERISKLLARYPARFIQRILSTKEQEILSKKSSAVAFLAKRFAAKEAIAKALGTGIGKNLAFNQMSILNTSEGQPYVEFTGAVLLEKMEAMQVMISLSDEKEHALAFAIVVKNK